GRARRQTRTHMEIGLPCSLARPWATGCDWHEGCSRTRCQRNLLKPFSEDAPMAAVATAARREDSGVFMIADGAIAQRRGDLEDEAALVFALIANDARAWRDFQQKYDRLILRCITKVTKRFSRISQEDVR